MLKSIEALPVKTYNKVKDRGYILVDTKKVVSQNNTSKPAKQAGANLGNCDFTYDIDEETARIPSKLNVAVLKNSAHETDCEKLTYDFTILEQCADCDTEDKHGIVYKITKQPKTVGFIKR